MSFNEAPEEYNDNDDVCDEYIKTNFKMKLIPLNFSSTSPYRLIKEPEPDQMVIVNFDLVYQIVQDFYYPQAGKPVEGSRLYITGCCGGNNDARPYTIAVKETRVEILRLLEGPQMHSTSKHEQK